MIVVFGSLNIDIVMSLDHWPRGGETLCVQGTHFTPGGKGANQAIAAKRAGADVALFGAVGDDSFGETLKQTLAQEKVSIGGIATGLGSVTGCACVCVHKTGENTILVSPGANHQAVQTQVHEALLSPENSLLLQMEVSPEENWALVKRAADRGMSTFLNLAPAAPVPEGVLHLLDGLLMNEGEAETLAQHLGMPYESHVAFARTVAERYDMDVLVTLGPGGALLATPDQAWHASAMIIQPLDTTAAGDSFIGMYAASLDLGFAPQDALHRATIAGGLACLKPGALVSIPCAEDVQAHLARVSLPEVMAC